MKKSMVIGAAFLVVTSLASTGAIGPVAAAQKVLQSGEGVRIASNHCPSGSEWVEQTGQCMRPAPAPPPPCTGGRVWVGHYQRCMCPWPLRWDRKTKQCVERPPSGRRR